MTLDQLRYFSAVCNHGSVSLGAQSLNISQPSVSNAIANLEKEFGVELFTRHRKKLILTEEGRRLSEMADSLLSQADGIVSTMEELGKQNKVLRLGVPPMIGSLVLPTLFQNYFPLYPSVQVRIVEDDNSGLKHLLEDNQIDLAFLPHTQPFEGQWNSAPLTVLQNVCFVNKSHPLAKETSVTLEQLQEQELVLFKNSFFQTQRILDAFSRLQCQPKIALYTAQLSTMQNMILSNHAVGFMFDFLTKTTPELVGIPLNPPMTTQVSLVWKKSRPATADMKKLIAYTPLLSELLTEFL